MDLLSELPNFTVEDALTKRTTCTVCARPSPVCVCYAINERAYTDTTVVILQHPAEEHRPLRTAPLLCAGLHTDKTELHIGKKFTHLSVLSSPTTALLYPAEGALECCDVRRGVYTHLVCLDGTWPQAKQIYLRNPALQRLPKVMLRDCRKSVYLIHTQPTDQHLSTLESVARALQSLEHREGLEELLVRPLKELVRLQFNFGAVAHRTRADAKLMRKKEIKEGAQYLTIAPVDEQFDYDGF